MVWRAEGAEGVAEGGRVPLWLGLGGAAAGPLRSGRGGGDVRVVVILVVGAVVAFGLSLVLPVWLYVVALFAGEVVGGVVGGRLPTRAVEVVVRRRAVGWWLVNDAGGRGRLAMVAAGGGLALSILLFDGAQWYVALGLWVLVGLLVGVEYLWFRREVGKELAERG